MDGLLLCSNADSLQRLLVSMDLTSLLDQDPVLCIQMLLRIQDVLSRLHVPDLIQLASCLDLSQSPLAEWLAAVLPDQSR